MVAPERPPASSDQGADQRNLIRSPDREWTRRGGVDTLLLVQR